MKTDHIDWIDKSRVEKAEKIERAAEIAEYFATADLLYTEILSAVCARITARRLEDFHAEMVAEYAPRKRKNRSSTKEPGGTE